MSKEFDHIVKAGTDLYKLIIEEISNQSVKKYGGDKYTFEQLTNWRQVELPSILEERFKSKKHTWLTKDELVLLMDWKLAAGKFRPMLPKLIKSNEADVVKETTTAGFDILLQFKDRFGTKQYQDTVKSSLKKLSELRGVGPATASLMLSLLHKINEKLAPPFFSDESFIYYVVEPTRPGTPIKYNVKEYIEELLPVYFKLVSNRKDISIQVFERGAWSLEQIYLNRLHKLSDVKIPFTVDETDIKAFNDTDGSNSTKKEDLDDGPQKKKRRK
ncbi:hypothetical protein DFJ63DRAFT_161078 [Scheffersomyces coipomensis]|uniref:uncharacterized protein n=1 Tax=Scheffersomyces coipomensis TaxID=1788519 RepID=UPI00315D5053